MLVKPVAKGKNGEKPVEAEQKELEQTAAPVEEIGTDELLRELEAVLEVRKDETPKAEPAAEKKPAKLAPAKAAPADRQNEKTEAPDKEPVSEQAPAPKEDAPAEKTPAPKEDAPAEKTPAPKENAPAEKTPAPKANAVSGKAPVGDPSRDSVDDEAFLAELHALIGDPEKPKQTAHRSGTPAASSRLPLTAPAPRPVVRITPDALKDVPDEYEDIGEADTMGVPGWVKGLFILLISLLLGAMTFYAVASDVAGKIF